MAALLVGEARYEVVLLLRPRVCRVGEPLDRAEDLLAGRPVVDAHGCSLSHSAARAELRSLPVPMRM